MRNKAFKVASNNTAGRAPEMNSIFGEASWIIDSSSWLNLVVLNLVVRY